MCNEENLMLPVTFIRDQYPLVYTRSTPPRVYEYVHETEQILFPIYLKKE